MLDILRAAALLAATMTIGIGAGVFQLYNFAIMPGLRRTDDRTFVGAFQQIDTAIIGPWLFLFSSVGWALPFWRRRSTLARTSDRPCLGSAARLSCTWRLLS